MEPYCTGQKIITYGQSRIKLVGVACIYNTSTATTAQQLSWIVDGMDTFVRVGLDGTTS